MDLSGGKRDPDRALLDGHGGRPEPEVPVPTSLVSGSILETVPSWPLATHTRFVAERDPGGAVANRDRLDRPRWPRRSA